MGVFIVYIELFGSMLFEANAVVGLGLVLQTKPFSVIAEPLELIELEAEILVWVIDDIVKLEIEGATAVKVVKLTSLLYVIPSELVAKALR